MTQLSLTRKKSSQSPPFNLVKSVREWLENNYCAPSFAGCVLGGIAISFFGAAVNTMSGWLYVLSGMIISLLVVAAFLCIRSLHRLKITRLPINAVSVEQPLIIELEIENPTTESKQSFQVLDLLPLALSGKSIEEQIQGLKDQAKNYSILEIKPRFKHRQLIQAIAQRRGIYHWEDILLRSGNPLGLFWCCRIYQVPAKAIVYPTILPLSHCPLIDTLGQDDSLLLSSDRRYQAANEGITKAIRPYRFGDPTRLIHWRTSARFGEFKVRELEIVTGGQNIIIGLDTSDTWQADNFEQAVTVAASIYSYAIRCQLNVQLWTAYTGLVSGGQRVLEALAAVEAEDTTVTIPPTSTPLIWLTQNALTINSLSSHNRWIFFPCEEKGNNQLLSHSRGITINAKENTEIQKQLQGFLLN